MSTLLLKRRLLITIFLLLTTSYLQAHSGPLNQIALKACDVKSRSQSCQYEAGHQSLYIGTCQYMSEVLMCVRNQPIQKIEANNNESTTEEHKHD